MQTIPTTLSVRAVFTEAKRLTIFFQTICEIKSAEHDPS